MRIKDIIWLSAKNLWWRKVRTLLTTGGVMIGVGTIVFLMSFTEGIRQAVLQQVGDFTTLQTITVSPDTTSSHAAELNNASVSKILEIKGVSGGQPQLTIGGQLQAKDTIVDSAIYGINPEYFALTSQSFHTGSAPSPSSDNWIVLSKQAASILKLDLSQKLTNSTLTIHIPDSNSQPITKTFTLAGILENNLSVQAYIPISTLSTVGYTNFSSYVLPLQSGWKSQVGSIRDQITHLGFVTEYVGDTTSQISRIFTILEVGLGSLGLIALFISILGVINTLTVNLLERTRELGFMKAIGYQERDIRRLLSTEALILSLIGGISGTILAAGAGLILNAVANHYAVQAGYPTTALFSFSWIILTISIVFSVFLGLVTGLIPSKRATRISPLEAMRYV